MASKNKTDSLRTLGCEKLLKVSLTRPNFFHFQKANGNLFFLTQWMMTSVKTILSRDFYGERQYTE